MSLPKYLFITPLTPGHLQTYLRGALFQNHLDALRRQIYPNWQALIIGEEDKTEGNFTYIKTRSVIKEDKLMDAYNYILSMQVMPDYIIRLDDDDLISPVILQRVCNKHFDCFADRYHLFYDIISGKTAQQKRFWLPNTTIHKTIHALSTWPETGKPLFANDHSKTWHLYYKSKIVKLAGKFHPVYMRILSPTSITGKTGIAEYEKYLRTFGRWKNKIPEDFRDLIRIKFNNGAEPL